MKSWDDFLADTSLTLDDFVAEHVRAALPEQPIAETIERIKADTAAAHRQSEALDYEKAAREALLRGGVLPRAVDLMVGDVQEVFDLHDGSLVARNRQTDPADPLAPLTVERWLEGRRAHLSFLFVKP